jgi:hypothetical protein
MRSRSLIGLAMAATAACCLVEVSQTKGIVGFYREMLSPPMFACWLAGLLAATISPATFSVLFWLVAERRRYGGVVHLLLPPVVYAAFQASGALMLFATGEPDLDSLSGHAIVPATLLLIICPIVYFAALAVRRIGGRRRFAKAS